METNRSTLRERYNSYYSSRALAFVNELSNLDVSGIPEPHLPLWGKSYEDSSLRVGIVGRDTRTWGDMKDFVRAVYTDPIEAIHRSNDVFESLEFTEWTNNFGTSFWDTSMKILAGLHGISDWKQLKRREEDWPLKSFFWANTNSVEWFEVSSKNNGVPWETWRKVKDSSERYFDSFKAILDILKPHVVFLMNWEPGEYFLDFEIEWQEFGNHQAYAHDPSSETHILATAHPTWLNMNGLYGEAVSGIIEKANKTLHGIARKSAPSELRVMQRNVI